MRTAKDKYIGMTKMMNCGLEATIIAYRNAHDIDVQFETGFIRKHTGTTSFNQGEIAGKKQECNSEKSIGKTKIMNCGLKATIIAYRGCNDIDVQFETGAIRRHKQISSFTTGTIAEKPFDNNEYIGKTKMMNCGLKATIIAYRKAKDIDIQFETGFIRKHVDMSGFTKCQIAYPEDKIFGIYTIEKKAFIFHDKTYFYVSYQKNNTTVTDIMSVDDMRNAL